MALSSEPGEYVVELAVFVKADSATDAEALGERAAREAMKAFTPRSAGTATITKVIVADVEKRRLSAVVDDGTPTGAARLSDYDPRLLVQAQDRIYDVLVRTCDAPDDESTRSQFLHFCRRTDDPREFRFIGALGFGGKFWTHGWRVDCYPEDDTPDRSERINRANHALEVLREQYA